MTLSSGIITGLATCLLASSQDPGRVGAERKGSLLLYSAVEVRWDVTGQDLLQDTFIELTNDYPQDVWVQLYYINGDSPLEALYEERPHRLVERAHTGWNSVGMQLQLTSSEPTYWSISTGLPAMLAPFTVLDPGDPPGRPSPDPTYGEVRVLRGYIIAWAVDRHGREIRWNHLSGRATVVDYDSGSAWVYVPWAFQAHSAPHGVHPSNCLTVNLESGQCAESEIIPGQLDLDGFEYDSCPDKLLFGFWAAGSMVPGPPDYSEGVPVDTSLLLMPCDIDLRQDGIGPVTTKARFDIWNQNEVHFSGAERCITCWDLTSLQSYTTFGVANHFYVEMLQTDRGKARIQGLASDVCDTDMRVTRRAALLGMALKTLQFETWLGKTSVPMSIQGYEAGSISYDVIEPPEEKGQDR
jgi:hypothetical protein